MPGPPFIGVDSSGHPLATGNAADTLAVDLGGLVTIIGKSCAQTIVIIGTSASPQAGDTLAVDKLP